MSVSEWRKEFSETYNKLKPYFINTVFDSAFTILGIIVGSAFSENFDHKIFLGTLLAGTFSLGISSGVSVYEAETLQAEKKIKTLEESLLRDLDETLIVENEKRQTAVVSVIIFLTPILTSLYSLTPQILSLADVLHVKTTIWISVSLTISLLFLTGYVFSEENREQKIWRGLRMMVLGVVAFLVGFGIKSLV